MKNLRLLFLPITAMALMSCSSVTKREILPVTTQELAARLALRFPKPHLLSGTFSVVDAKGRPVKASWGAGWHAGTKVSLTGLQVAARPGQKVKIESIREFIYPLETNPPTIKGDMATAPTVPKSFATKNLGWEIDSLRMTTQGGFIIVSGTFRETVFMGFRPAAGALFSPIINSAGQILTENRLENPVFITRETSFHIALLPDEIREVSVPLASGPAFLRISAKAINHKSGREIKPVP